MKKKSKKDYLSAEIRPKFPVETRDVIKRLAGETGETMGGIVRRWVMERIAEEIKKEINDDRN